LSLQSFFLYNSHPVCISLSFFLPYFLFLPSPDVSEWYVMSSSSGRSVCYLCSLVADEQIFVFCSGSQFRWWLLELHAICAGLTNVLCVILFELEPVSSRTSLNKKLHSLADHTVVVGLWLSCSVRLRVILLAVIPLSSASFLSSFLSSWDGTVGPFEHVVLRDSISPYSCHHSTNVSSLAGTVGPFEHVVPRDSFSPYSCHHSTNVSSFLSSRASTVGPFEHVVLRDSISPYSCHHSTNVSLFLSSWAHLSM
jgi:hypothetical protein